MVAIEILNALIQKGLRPCCFSVAVVVRGNTECPDSKGIKTSIDRSIDVLAREILNALIQKGLRQIRGIEG